MEKEKTDEQIKIMCNCIIDSLSDFSIEDKYRVVSNLYFSLLDVAKKEGIVFIELNKK